MVVTSLTARASNAKCGNLTAMPRIKLIVVFINHGYATATPTVPMARMRSIALPRNHICQYQRQRSCLRIRAMIGCSPVRIKNAFHTGGNATALMIAEMTPMRLVVASLRPPQLLCLPRNTHMSAENSNSNASMASVSKLLGFAMDPKIVLLEKMSCTVTTGLSGMFRKFQMKLFCIQGANCKMIVFLQLQRRSIPLFR